MTLMTQSFQSVLLLIYDSMTQMTQMTPMTPMTPMTQMTQSLLSVQLTVPGSWFLLKTKNVYRCSELNPTMVSVYIIFSITSVKSRSTLASVQCHNYSCLPIRSITNSTGIVFVFCV